MLASGRDSEVFDYGVGLVLRRYRDGRDAGPEAQLLRFLGRRGYPVPRVESQVGPDIMMERVMGMTLAEAIQVNVVEPSAAGRILAELHRRLHDLTWSVEGAVLHLDLHPANVLVGENGPVVIDWCNARRGSPAFDVAVTALILAQVAITPGLVSSDPAEDAAARAAAPDVLAAYAGTVSGGFLHYLDEAMAMRLQDRYQSPRELMWLPEAADLARSVAPPSKLRR